MKIPKLVLEVATRLHQEGCIYSEAYPLRKWNAMGWPDEPRFHQLVDGCLKIMRALETLPSGSWSDS